MVLVPSLSSCCCGIGHPHRLIIIVMLPWHLLSAGAGVEVVVQLLVPVAIQDHCRCQRQEWWWWSHLVSWSVWACGECAEEM